MKKKKEPVEFRRLPKGFKHWKGRCSFDMPQELYSEKDKKKIEIVFRNGEIKKLRIMNIVWTATYEKTDIVGYLPPDVKRKRRAKNAANSKIQPEAR